MKRDDVAPTRRHSQADTQRATVRCARAIFASAIAFGVSGCRLSECPPQRFSLSNISSQAVPTAPLVVRGRVLSLDSALALPTARVRLLSSDSSWYPVGADGSFAMRTMPPGAYTIEVAAAGFEFASGRVSVSADSAVSVVAVLERMRPQSANAVCGERPVVR